MVFKLRDGLGRRSNEQGCCQDEAKELALPDSPCAALLRIDLQLQMTADPLAHDFQHPLRSSLAADVNVAVIRVANVPQSPAFDLLVELVQIDVGQQW